MPQAPSVIFRTRGGTWNELGNAYLNKGQVSSRKPAGISDQQDQGLVAAPHAVSESSRGTLFAYVVQNAFEDGVGHC